MADIFNIYGMDYEFSDFQSFSEDGMWFYVRATRMDDKSVHDLEYDVSRIWEDMADAEDWKELNDSDQEERVIDHIDWLEPTRIDGEDPDRYWYAYQETEDEREEGCWDGCGGEDRHEAINWLASQVATGNADAQVAVVRCDADWNGIECVETITADDI